MINLIASFYILKKQDTQSLDRNSELLEALQNNIKCKYIEKIHLYVDDNDALNKVLELKSDKINIIMENKKYNTFFYIKRIKWQLK